MAIIKEIEHQIIVLNDGQLQVAEITKLMEDGLELSAYVNRHVVDVGDDVSAESQLVQDTANNLHTPARIADRAAFKAAQEAALNQET